MEADLAGEKSGEKRETEKGEEMTEQPHEWYDQIFASTPHYAVHYTKSPYYGLWSAVADAMGPVESVLDLGCGTGQFACLLADRGVKKYLGMDFSPVALDMARAACPRDEFYFMIVNLCKGFAASLRWDCVVAIEVLEHVQCDLEVIGSLRDGQKIIATVPTFPYESHVRHFTSAETVIERYESVLDNLVVRPVESNGLHFFLMEGRGRRDRGQRQGE